MDRDRLLFGRDAELTEIELLLDGVRANGGRTLVIEGQPGIGKTTLWREGLLLAEARGYLVLSARPTEPEAKLSYSALTDVLERLPAGAFDTLPAAQREALEVALLRAPVGAVDAEPRAVAAGVRGALIEAARGAPILVAIDDAQWLDPASAGVLAHALRRVEGAPVAALVAQRPPEPGRHARLDLPDAAVLRLDGLSVAAVHELVKARYRRSLPHPLLVRLHEACAGNPFFALEVARELDDSQLGAATPLPVPGDVRQTVNRHVARLSGPAKVALLVAAAAGAPTRDLLNRVIGADSTEALAEAEAADVLTPAGDSVVFSHPLYAAAVYAAAPRAGRVAVHQRLANAVSSAEERAWHLALAAERPTASIAAEIEQAAAEVRARGAAAAAGALLLEAARLTPGDEVEEQHRRELAGAQAFFDAGEMEAAPEILARLLGRIAPGPDRARALLLLALIQSYGGEHGAAAESCRRAIDEASSDPRLLAEAHLRFALVVYDDALAARQSAAAARTLVEADPGAANDLVAAVLLDDAYQGLFLGEGLRTDQVERAIALVPPHGRTWSAQRAQVVVCLWTKYTDDLVRSRDAFDQVIRLRREEGDDYEALLDVRHLAEVECWLGNWERAGELAREADGATSDRAVTLYGLSLVAACRGDVDDARAAAEEGLKLSGDNPWYRTLNLSVLGFLELSLGDAAAAATHLDQAAEHVAQMGMVEPCRFRFDGDRIEALVALGRLDDAAALTETLRLRRSVTPRPWNCVMHARGLALVRAAEGDFDEAFAAIDDALREHERLPMPLELGRTWLAKGEIERRAKRRGAAKQSLERALAEFDRLGARLWAERASSSLKRTGLRRQSDDLTANERRIAELAASGLTNREVAARLFLSPKTVEANLARAYRKLGIHSRAELGARFVDRGQEVEQT